MIDKKRVVCFYRVSTKQQMIDNDIPVQRNACIGFINKHPDWIFSGEYIEKGVSGFKVKASDREKLEELKTDALVKKFDILLVFMFDRLGRIEEETPFVLKWFVDQGIEVWSVNEGQRKFNSHVDNLLNYITFWQASGESKKTQIRTREVKEQMVEEGRYLGGSAAYGYKHIPTGTHNEKGREIKKLVINEEEAKVVKQMFDLVTIKGYGSRRIAKYLNDNGIPTKKNKLWAGQSVASILKNSIYKGYFTYGRVKTTENGDVNYLHQYSCKTSNIKHEDLVIISEEQWNEVKKIIESRSGKNLANIPKQTKSPLLLTGYIYCKKCGSRMTLKYSYNHYKRKDGTVNRDRKPFYQCYGKSSGRLSCNSKNYASKNIELVVLNQVYNYLDSLEQMNIDLEIKNNEKEGSKHLDKIIKLKKDNIKRIEDDIKLLKNEILNVIKGTSHFTEELLSEQIKDRTNELEKQQQELISFESDKEKTKLKNEELILFKQSIPTYRKILQSEDVESKKMLLPKLIERVDVDENECNVIMNTNIHELLQSYSQYNA